MTPKRAYGTGSITYEAARQRWVGSIETGWTARGTRRRKRVTGKTKAVVQRKILAALREAEQNQAPTVGGKPTVKVWADVWLDITANRIRPTTWQSNKSQVANWIIPTVGHRRLDALTPADIRTVERAMTVAGKKPSTMARCMSVLTWMLKDAVLEGHAIPQAALMVQGPNPGESDRDVIPIEDALLILEAAALRPDASRWVAALLQGMRPAECLGLTWGSVDFDARVITVSWQLKRLPYVVARDRASGFRVPQGYEARQVYGGLHLVRPKTKAGWRVIPMVPWMADALTAWKYDCPATTVGLVWPTPAGMPRVDRDDRAAWVELQDAARVARVDGTIGRRYDLYEARHTAATLLKAMGADDATITAIFGHSSILSTRAYLHTDLVKLRAALEGMAQRLRLGPTPSIEP